MDDSLPIDQGIVWYLPTLRNLRLMRAQYVQHAFKPHAHDYFVLGIVVEGLQTFTHGRQHLVTSPGDIIIINPGEIHTGESALPDGFFYRALYPTPELMHAILQEFSKRQVHSTLFSGGIVNDPSLFRWLRHLHEHSEQSLTPMELEDNLTHLLVRLVQRHAHGSFHLEQYRSAHQSVSLVRDYLEAHFQDPITLSDLSMMVNISAFHLSRLFRKQTGLPPHKYLENVRVQHAERLLTAGASIAETAYSTGFSSQSHFTRTFKNFLGTTPGEFTKRN